MAVLVLGPLRRRLAARGGTGGRHFGALAPSLERNAKHPLVIPGAFRQAARVDGVTIVADERSAHRALAELRRLGDRAHAWDTESVGVAVRGKNTQSPVNHGRVLCATCFCGDDADFGNGPRLFIDNDGPAAGLLERHFAGYFEEAAFKKVFHNYSFDSHLLRRHRIVVGGFYADTLHLARLYDTSFASWEAEAIRQRGRASISASASGSKRQVAVASPDQVRGAGGMRKVRTVKLGGTILKSAATDSTIVMPDLPETTAVSAPTGYGLKYLACHFGLSSGRPKEFAELFGCHVAAAEEAHNSPDNFHRWVEYATSDAVLTYGLFERLRAELEGRKWYSPVHARPIAEICRDKRVLKDLLNKRSVACQYDTGKTMWDFVEMYMREYALCLAKLERVGLPVDLKALRRIEAEAGQEIKACHADFVDCVGSLPAGLKGEEAALNPDAGSINIRSAQQMQTLLFGGSGKNKSTGEVLPSKRSFPKDAASTAKDGTQKSVGRIELRGIGLQPAKKRRHFTKAGWPSTSSSTLRELAGSAERPGVAYTQLLEKGYSEEDAGKVGHALRRVGEANRIKSLVSGFAEPLQRHGEATGRIHPSWAFDTSTGRLACRRPNLQNLPAEHHDKYRLRDAFRADPEKIFVVADYSQLEMRVLAHMTGDPSMVANLSRGGDYHSETAVEMFPHIAEAVASGRVVLDKSSAGSSDLPTVKDVFGRERGQAKAVNFAIVYGKEAVSLAEDLDIAPHEAEQLIDTWYRLKPFVKKWKEQVVRECRKDAYTRSLLGRWRTLPLIVDKERPDWRRRSERAAVNFGIQGSAADIVLAASLRFARHERLAELGFAMVSQVHDEFVFEGPEAHATAASDVVRDLMSKPFGDHNPDFEFSVPLLVDIGVGTSLYNAKS
mmetsp:Transcript_73332/g.203465  ORF Transcript_73332/g.203465 Transcript_73332/m.203465 type:complete len:896 (-) Transcript_73332:147-2834(-)